MNAAASPPPPRVMVFGKLPRPGRVKTRLAPVLGEAGAARLYDAFLEDVLELCRAAGTHPELWVPRRSDAGEVLPDRHPDVALRWQPQGDLGDRLRAAFEAAFREDDGRALVVGSDHPTLPPGHVEEALRALEEADACLGPTADGGYWAVGLRRRAWPRAARLFDDVPWSTPDVLETTLARAAEAGVEVRLASAWYDVDEPEDLERLRRDVPPDSATADELARLGRGRRASRAAGPDDGAAGERGGGA